MPHPKHTRHYIIVLLIQVTSTTHYHSFIQMLLFYNLLSY